MIFWSFCRHQISTMSMFFVCLFGSRCRTTVSFEYLFHGISMSKNLKLAVCIKFHLNHSYFFVYFRLVVVCSMTLIRFEKPQRMYFHLLFWKTKPFVPSILQKYRRNQLFRKISTVQNDLKIFFFTSFFQLFELFEKL